LQALYILQWISFVLLNFQDEKNQLMQVSLWIRQVMLRSYVLLSYSPS